MGKLEDACWGCQMGWKKFLGASGMMHDAPEPMGDLPCTAPKAEVNKKTHGKVDHTMAGRVEVKIDTDNPPFMRVTVYSGVKKGLLREQKASNQGSTEANAQMAGIMAGKMAESLCERYGDILNPSDAAVVAMGLCRDAIRQVELLEKGSTTLENS